MTPKSNMIFPILFMIVQYCTAQIHPEEWTIPIVSDEHGNLHFGDPFEQNETAQEESQTDKPQLMDKLPLSRSVDQEGDVELSSTHVSQPQAIKTLLTDQYIGSFSASSAEVHQKITNPEVHQQGVSSTLSQETVVIDPNIESTCVDLVKLLLYEGLGPISGDISIEPLSFDTDTELLFNDTCQSGRVSMRDAKRQPNEKSDPLAHLQTHAISSGSTKEKVPNVDGKRDGNMTCPTFYGSASGQLFGSIGSNSGQNVVQSHNIEQHFVNCAGRKAVHTSSDYKTYRQTLTGEKPFHCDICSKQFRTSNGYDRHQRIHTGEKPFKCDFCRKKFSDSGDWQRHRRTHTVEKPLQCDICSKHFYTSINYRTHRRICSGEKSFQCDICPKQFGTSSDYKRHRRTHTGEKPFKCDFCKKEFSDHGNFQRHRRTHTGKKPFQCDICLKQFGTSSGCQTHRRIHTGEKPFKCDFCDRVQ